MAALVAALALATSAFVPAAEAQSSGLNERSDTTYTVDVANQRVTVESSYDIRNDTPPTKNADGSTTNYSFSNYGVAVPPTATNFTASVRGVELATTFIEKDGYLIAEMRLPGRLAYREKKTVRLSYTIPNSGARPGSGNAQISDDFVSLNIWAHGSPGQASVRVSLPAGFEVTYPSRLDAFTKRTTAGRLVLQASGIADPSTFSGEIVARRDVKLENTRVTLHSGTAVVLSRPSDTEWRDFVITTLTDDLPVLEELIGIPWPHANIVVEESTDPLFHGFGGWFSSGNSTIEIDEDLDRETLLHELSHGWFNERFTTDRWIKEGLAEEMSSRVIEATGDTRPDPFWPDPSFSQRVPLDEWENVQQVASSSQRAFEVYHYNTSWWVLRQITEEIGTEAFSEVLVEFEATASSSPNRDWRRLFDLVDGQTESDTFDALFETYVLTPGTEDLATRRQVLTSYDEVFGTVDIQAPSVLRLALSKWEWEESEFLIGRAAPLLPQLDAHKVRAAQSSIDTDNYDELFESAASTSELYELGERLTADLPNFDQLDADRAEALATATEHGLIIDSNYDSMALNVAEADVRATHRATRDIIANRSTLIADGAEVGIVFDLEPTATIKEAQLEVATLREQLDLYVERRTELRVRMDQLGLATPPAPDTQTLDAGERTLDRQKETIDALAIAEGSVASLSRTQRVGLIGKDIDTPLVEARDAFAAGAFSEASAQAKAVSLASTDANDRGRSRIVMLTTLVIGLLLAAFAVVAVRDVRRRRDKRENPIIQSPIVQSPHLR